MIRLFLDRLYLFSGFLAGLFLIAIFVLMMLLSAGRPLGLNIPGATISSPGAWRQPPSSASRIRSGMAR